MKHLLAMLLGFAVSLSPLGVAGAAEAIPVDGDAFQGQLATVDKSGDLTFVVEGEQKRLTTKELVRWGEPIDSQQGPQIHLFDGSVLVVDQDYSPLTTEDDFLIAGSRMWGLVKLPLSAIRSIVFAVSDVPHVRDAASRPPVDDVENRDRIVLRNGDGLSGIVLSLKVEADGESDKELLVLQSRGTEIELELSRVAQIHFNPALAGAFRDRQPLMVGFSDGSRFHVPTLQLDSLQASVKVTEEVTLTTTPDEVVFLQSFASDVVYLSDLKERSYKHVPYLSLSWPHRKDRNVLGGRLRAGGQLYLKGLGMHSAARIAYRLDKPYRRLEARLAVDDAAENQGSVRFRVYVDDGSGSWKSRFESDPIRGGQPPVPISVDLEGARQISLLVDFADRGDVRDYANWLEARLVP